MHKTKQKRDRNKTTTSLFLDSRGSRKFRLKPANLVAFKLSVFESRQISFLKIFLVIHAWMQHLYKHMDTAFVYTLGYCICIHTWILHLYLHLDTAFVYTLWYCICINTRILHLYYI